MKTNNFFIISIDPLANDISYPILEKELDKAIGGWICIFHNTYIVLSNVDIANWNSRIKKGAPKALFLIKQEDFLAGTYNGWLPGWVWQWIRDTKRNFNLP